MNHILLERPWSKLAGLNKRAEINDQRLLSHDLVAKLMLFYCSLKLEVFLNAISPMIVYVRLTQMVFFITRQKGGTLCSHLT